MAVRVAQKATAWRWELSAQEDFCACMLGSRADQLRLHLEDERRDDVRDLTGWAVTADQVRIDWGGTRIPGRRSKADGRVGSTGRPFRWGVLGCGRVLERVHLPGMAGMLDCELAWAWDPRPDRREFVRVHSPGVQVAESEGALLERDDINGLLICSPASQHPAQTRRALARGLPVLVEKPLALDLSEAQATVEVQRAQGLPVAVGFNRRFQPRNQRLKAWIGQAGAPLGGAEFDFTSPLELWDPIEFDEKEWDLLGDVASHQIDLLRWLLEQEVIRARARRATMPGESLESVRYQLEFASGIVAKCEASHAGAYVERVAFRGEGRTYLSDSQGAFWLPRSVESLAGLISRILRYKSRLAPGQEGSPSGHAAELRAFMDWVRTGRRPADLATAEEGLRVTAVVDALKGSLGQGGDWVDVRRNSAEAPGSGTESGVGRKGAMSTKAAAGADSRPDLQDDRPDVSVVVIVGDRRRRAGEALSSLLRQPGMGDQEIILVDASRVENPAPIAGMEDPSVKVLKPQELVSFGELRTLGFRASRGRLVAYMEEHVIALDGWLEAVRSHLDTEWAGIGGEMHSANPGVGVSDAIALMNYTSWRPPAQAGETSLLPGQNCVYRREVLAAYGEDLPQFFENEAILNSRMVSDGHRLVIDPALKFSHRDEVKLPQICRGYFHWHRSYGSNRVAKEGKGWPWRILRSCLWPLVPLVRAYRMGKTTVTKRPSELGLFLRSLPVILVAQAAAGLGMAVGILFGRGGALEVFLNHELNIDRPKSNDQG